MARIDLFVAARFGYTVAQTLYAPFPPQTAPGKVQMQQNGDADGHEPDAHHNPSSC